MSDIINEYKLAVLMREKGFKKVKVYPYGSYKEVEVQIFENDKGEKLYGVLKNTTGVVKYYGDNKNSIVRRYASMINSLVILEGISSTKKINCLR